MKMLHIHYNSITQEKKDPGSISSQGYTPTLEIITDYAKAKEEIEEILALIESGSFHMTEIYPDWELIGYAVADYLGEEGRFYYHRICKYYPEYSDKEANDHYSKCLTSNMQNLPMSNITHYARKAGKEDQTQTLTQENSNSKDDTIFEKGATFPDQIYPALPDILHKVIRYSESSEEKDMLLLGSMTTISACLPNIYGIYDGRTVYPNLFLFVSGNAAVGKGRLILCKGLVQPIHQERREESKMLKEQFDLDLAYANSPEGKKAGVPKPVDPPEKMLFIPANSSASGVFQILSDSDGSGIIFETEGDTLQQTFKTEYGNYNDGFRKAFHHESISFYRRTNRESVEITNPKLSAVLSGTPRQVETLIPDAENGLFSRFIFYNLKVQTSWRNVFEIKETGLDSYFGTLGSEFYSFQTKLKRSGRQIEIRLTDEQQEKFNQIFSNLVLKYFNIHGPEYVATIRRLGLIGFRLCMILTALRIKDPVKSNTVLHCSEIDFQTVLKMVKVMLKHSESIFVKLPEARQVIHRKSLKEKFYEGLPASFDRHTFHKIAETFSIPTRTADGYIGLFVKSNILFRDKHNLYTKKIIR